MIIDEAQSHAERCQTYLSDWKMVTDGISL